jgi:polyferredoxin
LAIFFIFAIIAFYFLGNELSAKSAFYGGIAALIPNVYFARKALLSLLNPRNTHFTKPETLGHIVPQALCPQAVLTSIIEKLASIRGRRRKKLSSHFMQENLEN